jgi:hypothetical protein
MNGKGRASSTALIISFSGFTSFIVLRACLNSQTDALASGFYTATGLQLSTNRRNSARQRGSAAPWSASGWHCTPIKK